MTRIGPGALVCFVLSAAACSDLTEPVSTREIPRVAPEPRAAAAKPAETAPAPEPAPTAPPTPSGEQVGASHILVAYKGGMRAAETITRTKEEAKARATQLLARARKGEDFGKLATENSDDPSAKMNQGALGKFTRERMVKPFADAAFALKPGEFSELVETPFGFHVIKRTE
jgi:parvulin-like peptidyl-prolyl isomerase